jgi:type III secretion protein C
MFSADVQQNAVIVRDRKINIPLYDSLIRKFDRKPTLIEISVMIMDVNSEDLSALGIDWSASTQIGGGSVSFNSSGKPSSDSFSSVISNTGTFMIRLNALQQNAKAQILSRPSVVTLDNTEAVLDRSITFHTKLVSREVAKLESLTTGSMLRVTPRLIDEGTHKEMMLKLVIQDGRQISAYSEHEPLPQTLSSEVATQTLLRAGQSLLLGGFVQDEQSEGERKIPLLGDIPVLGKLFRSTQKNSRSTVRLFLIKAEPSLQP